MGWNRSTAASVVASISSSRDGVATFMIFSAARPALARSGNTATVVVGAAGSGRSRSRASVITPRVPSLPTNRLTRS